MWFCHWFVIIPALTVVAMRDSDTCFVVLPWCDAFAVAIRCFFTFVVVMLWLWWHCGILLHPAFFLMRPWWCWFIFLRMSHCPPKLSNYHIQPHYAVKNRQPCISQGSGWRTEHVWAEFSTHLYAIFTTFSTLFPRRAFWHSLMLVHMNSLMAWK